MIAELILIRKLLEKTPHGSTPTSAVLPKSFVKPFQTMSMTSQALQQRPKTITRKKSIGPALGLKKYF